MVATGPTIVIGGGIAGLSAGWQLAERGRRVTVLERESVVASHSSARNAQIWLPIEDDATTGPLAVRSAELLTGLLGEERAWLSRSGALVLVDDAAAAASLVRGAARGGLCARPIDLAAARRRCPVLEGRARRVLAVEGAGVFDPHRMNTALAAAARAAGATIETGVSVRRILTDERRVTGVELDSGEQLESDCVVIAAGAWAGALGAELGATTTLRALRRHLVLLDAPAERVGTVVWSFGGEEVYFRPESGGVLASPCDEEELEPCLPTPEPAALERLGRVLPPVAPGLLEAPVRTSWACLRTFADDRELVLGPDPRVAGLAWLAGLGGRGMTVGVAAAELAVSAMYGEPSPLLDVTRPDR